MTDPTQIRALSDQRLQEAQTLFAASLFDGAFYLSGYCVELSLKAKICERLGIPNLYDEQANHASISGISDLKKTLKSHNLLLLLIMSGLKDKFDRDKAVNRELTFANSLLFNGWDEKARYKPCGHMAQTDIQRILEILESPTGLLTWIAQN